MDEEVKMSEYDSGTADEVRVPEWEFGLPAADALTPLSQALISPELASAFSISLEPCRAILELNRAFKNTFASLRVTSTLSQGFSSNNYIKSFVENRDAIVMDLEEGDQSDTRKSRKIDAIEEADSALRLDNNSGDDRDPSARTSKRPRLVWTPQLHKRFVDVVAHLGINKAVPKTIMQMMNVEGLTRENVASHLQKYRLYLKRMQGLSNEPPSLSDQLFASTPVPPSLHEHGGHGNGNMPVPIPMPLAAPPMIMPMPVYGMPMGMQIAKSGGGVKAYPGFESNPYMMQQRDWAGNRYGSFMSYPQSTAPDDK